MQSGCGEACGGHHVKSVEEVDMMVIIWWMVWRRRGRNDVERTCVSCTDKLPFT